MMSCCVCVCVGSIPAVVFCHHFHHNHHHHHGDMNDPPPCPTHTHSLTLLVHCCHMIWNKKNKYIQTTNYLTDSLINTNDIQQNLSVNELLFLFFFCWSECLNRHTIFIWFLSITPWSLDYCSGG